MATAVNPLRVDGRRSAANVEVCGWGRPPISYHLAVPDGHGDRRALHDPAHQSGSTRSNNKAGQFSTGGRTRSTDGFEAFAIGAQGSGNDLPGKTACDTPQAKRPPAASFPSA